MKKLLLSTAALAVMAVAAPAMAADDGVKLSVAGHFKGYVAVTNQDTVTSVDERTIDILRETEIHLSGETTLDNGLTVGAHFEIEADGDEVGNNGSIMEESYVYFSGDWGRVNFGAEDSAAYLLQVAAPSADSNVDGLRVYINPVNYALVDTQIAGVLSSAALTGSNNSSARFDYDQDTSGKFDKVTYLTPVFSGFQAGLSYTPEVGEYATGLDGASREDEATDTNGGEAWDLGLRYEGQFDQVGVTAGLGFSNVEEEGNVAARDDRQAWNAGLDLDFGPFGLGVAYLEDDMGLSGSFEKETFVIGADYTTGAFKLGASYYNQDAERGTGNAELETERYTGGVVYTYGPGMTFRGSVSYIDHEMGTGNDADATSVLLGTQIKF